MAHRKKGLGWDGVRPRTYYPTVEFLYDPKAELVSAFPKDLKKHRKGTGKIMKYNALI